jgi:hypothetical protein
MLNPQKIFISKQKIQYVYIYDQITTRNIKLMAEEDSKDILQVVNPVSLAQKLCTAMHHRCTKPALGLLAK